MGLKSNALKKVMSEGQSNHCLACVLDTTNFDMQEGQMLLVAPWKTRGAVLASIEDNGDMQHVDRHGCPIGSTRPRIPP